MMLDADANTCPFQRERLPGHDTKIWALSVKKSKRRLQRRRETTLERMYLKKKKKSPAEKPGKECYCR
jgi:hypothetical protein